MRSIIRVRSLGFALTLILTTGLAGCGLEVLITVALLVPNGPTNDLLLTTRSKIIPRMVPQVVTPTDDTLTARTRAASSTNQNAGRGEVDVQLQPVIAASSTSRPVTMQKCDCLSLNCQLPIEGCGQLWAPHYTESMQQPWLTPIGP